MNTKTKVVHGLDVEPFFKAIDEMIVEDFCRGETVLELRRDKVVFSLMYGLGLKMSELLNLDVDDVHEVSPELMPYKGMMELHIYSDSPNKVRHVLVYNQNLSALLNSYLYDVRPDLIEETCCDEDALFLDGQGYYLRDSILEDSFELILRHAGLDRQTYSIDALRKEGLAAMKAQEPIRHRRGHYLPSTTKGYNPSDPVLKALIDAHRKAIENNCSDDNHAAVDGEESSQ